MKLVDANVLLYAVNASDPHHDEARDWLDSALGRQEAVGFAWVVVLAFMRLSTKIGLFPAPVPTSDAIRQVEEWLSQPPSLLVEPTTRHLGVLSGLLNTSGTGGNLVTDAHLAALATEHDATVVTYDYDFGRFAGVRWHPPGP